MKEAEPVAPVLCVMEVPPLPTVSSLAAVVTVVLGDGWCAWPGHALIFVSCEPVSCLQLLQGLLPFLQFCDDCPGLGGESWDGVGRGQDGLPTSLSEVLPSCRFVLFLKEWAMVRLEAIKISCG